VKRSSERPRIFRFATCCASERVILANLMGTKVHEGPYWAICALIWACLVAPILAVAIPPLHDYPNHLARMYILAHFNDVPSFRGVYSAQWLPYGNLAEDLLLPPALHFIDPQLGGKLFLIALPTLTLFGADRLARALHGRPSWAAPLFSFFFYNTLFLYGFLNYVFGVGLYLVAFAVWVRAFQGRSAWRFAAAAVLMVACYIAHKTSFAFLAVSITGWLIAERKHLSARDLVVQFAVMAPVGLIEKWGGVPGADLDEPTTWDFAGKAKALASLVSSYHPGWDLVTAGAFLAVLGWLLWRHGHRNRAATMGATALAALFLFGPSDIGGSWAVDRRFLVASATLALAATALDLSDGAARAAYATLIALVVARAAVQTVDWRRMDADRTQRMALVDAVPRGARVFGFALLDREDKEHWARQMGLKYLHHYAVVRRDAQVNGLFAKPNAQPLRVPEALPLRQAPLFGVPPEAVDWAEIFRHSDHVIATTIDDAYRRFLEQHCRPVKELADAGLYRDCRP